MLLLTVQRALGTALVPTPTAAAALVLTAFGCSFPSPEACALACGEDGACPGGFECQTSTALCVPRGMTTPCEERGIIPLEPRDDGRDDAGLGGSGPGGSMPDADTGGAPAGAGGMSGVAGTSGDPATEELSIVSVGLAEPSACTGVELAGVLRASGGEGPYRWTIVEAPPGAEASVASADELALGGVPSEPGVLVIELEDATGTTERTELIVHARPAVALDALPAMCAGEGYGVELLATGGEPDDYVWSAALASSDGDPPTLEELGLRVEGSRLTGDIVAGRAEAPLRLLVDVSDAHCRSSRVELELDVLPSESDECPSIELIDSAARDELPPPCLGNAYSETLGVVGGAEPYLWSEVSVPPGLSFDADTGRIEGIARGDGVLTVEVTDGNSRIVQKSYDVVLRDHCWLAFVASEPGPAHLDLVDGRLIERQPEAARRRLPEATGLEPVVDFQFSPDGRFIAYRLGGDPASRRMEVARLSNGRAAPIDTSGAVSAYAWSSDASTLALLLDEGGQSRLGGVDVSAIDATALDPEAALDGLRLLAPVAAPRADSTLTWYGDDRLAFFSGAAGAERHVVTALLRANRFAAPAPRASVGFSDAARLLAGAGGVFVAEPATGLHEFFADAVDAPTPHADGVVIAPSGAFAGLARSGAARVFRPDRASDAAAALPSFEAD
ncbi:MAG TPA: hypothetical protein VMG12_12020, partial [Polyangiaceae bacterium]|nr:hypothetical protein [Polyangiaceae bacterium]